jgi:xanthine dehydrogenase accessory factor
VNAETIAAALSLLDRRESFAWVVILDTEGSTPRHAGAGMLVRADGSTAGTVGGGPLEGRAISRSLDVLGTGETVVERFDAALLGMACGGGGLMLVERIEAGDPKAREFFQALAALLESGRRGWSVTTIRKDDTGRTSVTRQVTDSAPLTAGDSAHTFIQPVGAQGKAYVFGAGHCGQKLAPILATLGFHTTVVDDRSDFANKDRFPTADRIVVPDSFAGALDALEIGRDGYVIIVTRGHAHDQTVLAQALRTEARYIGMIGSRKKVAACFEALAAEGFTSADLARVHAPIGLSIGAETPEEIAISIAAELIQVRAAKEA